MSTLHPPIEDTNVETELESTLFGFVQHYVWGSVLCTFGLLGLGLTLMFVFDMDVAVEGQGQLRPQTYTPVKIPRTGRVFSIAVNDGEYVAAGDTLFVLDTRNERESLGQVQRDRSIQELEVKRVESQLDETRRGVEEEIQAKEAALSVEQLSEEKLRVEWQLASDLYEAETVAPPYALRVAAARRQLAEIELRQAKARRDEEHTLKLQLDQERLALRKLEETARDLQSRIDEAVVQAPESGTVTARDLDLRRGDHVTEGEPFLEIAVPNRWEMRTLVSDKVLPYLRTGQSVKLYLDAFPYLRYRVFQGQVRRFSLAPVGSGDRNQYVVDVTVEDEALEALIQGGLQLNGLKGSAKFVLRRTTVARQVWDYVREQVGKLRVSDPS